MALFLLQVSYTAEGWAAQLRHPQNRVELLKPVFDRLGGSMQQAWYTFGDYDVTAIMELPDNVSAAAFSMAAMAGGSVRAVKTTPLLSIEEGIQAMHTAAELGYRPPAGN
jgi:uncharacterized protein with GYD domain